MGANGLPAKPRPQLTAHLPQQNPPARPMAAHDGDLRWALTEEELEWCAALVAALAAEGTARPRPDLLLAQFAIVGKGDTEKTVECVNNYNAVVVDEYGYTFAANHGYAWNFWNRKWPGTYLPALPQHGKSCIVNDFHTYRPADLADDEFGLLVTDHLVMCEACNHDLEQIRTGSVFLTHCSELGWGNFSVDLQKRWNALHDNCYPVWFGRVRWWTQTGSWPLCSKYVRSSCPRRWPTSC